MSSLTQVRRDETFDEGRDEEERKHDEDEGADDVPSGAGRLGVQPLGIGFQELERGRRRGRSLGTCTLGTCPLSFRWERLPSFLPGFDGLPAYRG